MKINIIPCIVLAFSVAGCVTTAGNSRSQPQVTLGMTQQQVEAIYGNPRSVYRYKNGAATTGVQVLAHYNNGPSVGYINGRVATYN